MKPVNEWSTKRWAGVAVAAFTIQAIPWIFATPLIHVWLHHGGPTGYGFVFTEAIIMALPPLLVIVFVSAFTFERFHAMPVVLMAIGFGIFAGTAWRWRAPQAFALAARTVTEATSNAAGTQSEGQAERLLRKIRKYPVLLNPSTSQLQTIAEADTSRKGVIEFLAAARGLPHSQGIISHVANNGMVMQSDWDSLYHLVVSQAMNGNTLAQERLAKVTKRSKQ